MGRDHLSEETVKLINAIVSGEEIVEWKIEGQYPISSIEDMESGMKVGVVFDMYGRKGCLVGNMGSDIDIELQARTREYLVRCERTEVPDGSGDLIRASIVKKDHDTFVVQREEDYIVRYRDGVLWETCGIIDKVREVIKPSSCCEHWRVIFSDDECVEDVLYYSDHRRGKCVLHSDQFIVVRGFTQLLEKSAYKLLSLIVLK